VGAIFAVGAGERPAGFEQFSAAIDPQWTADTLAATDRVGASTSRNIDCTT
jgi:hypothetical protein